MMRSRAKSPAHTLWNLGLLALSTAVGVVVGVSAVARACPDYDPIAERTLELEAVELADGGAAPAEEVARWQPQAVLWTADGAGRIELREARAGAPGDVIFFIAEGL